MEWKCLQYLLFRKVDNTLILVFPGLHKITLIRYKRFKDWLTTRNPFTFEDSNLYSLSTGFISIAGEDEISCDDSERIGANTQAGMNGKRFTQVRFKRNDQAKPLDWWLVREYSNHRWSESIYQLNSIVYEIIRCCKKTGEQRVLLLLWNDQRAVSLFKNMMMHKPDKPSLWKALVTDEESNKLDLTSSQNNYSYVMDGGALLHRVC